VVDRRVWWSRRALALHAVIIVVVPTFIGLCIWQIDRALSGNGLSWAYVFEWPFFTGYALYMWWRFVHEVPEAEDLGAPRAEPHPRPDPAEDPELDAYNRYLADLNQQDQPKRWR
jgi:hypothetical protein